MYDENTEYTTMSDIQEDIPEIVDIEDVGSVMDEAQDLFDSADSMHDVEVEDATEADYLEGIPEELKEEFNKIEETFPMPQPVAVELDIAPEEVNDIVAPEEDAPTIVDMEKVEELGDVNEVSVIDRHDFDVKEDSIEAEIDETFNKEEFREESGITAPVEDATELTEDNVEVAPLGEGSADTLMERVEGTSEIAADEVPVEEVEGDDSTIIDDVEKVAGTESEGIDEEDLEDDAEEIEEEAEKVSDEDVDGDGDVEEEPTEAEAEEEVKEDVEEVEEEVTETEEVVEEESPADESETVNVEAVEDASNVAAELSMVVELDIDSNPIINEEQAEAIEEQQEVQVDTTSAIDNVTGVIDTQTEEVPQGPEEAVVGEVIKPEELLDKDVQEVLEETGMFHDEESAVVDGNNYDTPESTYNDVEAPSEETVEENADEEVITSTADTSNGEENEPIYDVEDGVVKAEEEVVEETTDEVDTETGSAEEVEAAEEIEEATENVEDEVEEDIEETNEQEVVNAHESLFSRMFKSRKAITAFLRSKK